MRYHGHIIIVYWLTLCGFECQVCTWLWLNVSPLYSVTSRNVRSILLSSCVNLIVLWI